MSRVRFTQLVTELASHAGLGPMAAEVLAVVNAAFETRDYVFPRPGSRTLGRSSALPPDVACVGEVDVREVLRRGAQSSEELDVLCAVTLLSMSASWPSERQAQLEIAHRLLWLETHSGLRCLSSVSAVLDGHRQLELAEALLALLTSATTLSPGEFAVGQAWLSSCAAPECASIAGTARELAFPESNSSGHRSFTQGGALAPLHGHLGPKPRNSVVTVLLAVTTLLFFARASRALGQLALNYRRPASLVLGSRGLELDSRLELLGKVLRERKQVVPLEEIRQVAREVRYPRLGLYAGLTALTLGTLLGTRLFVDGLRVSGLSFTMMAWGALLVVVGLGLDFLFSGLSDGVRGRCRVVVRTRGSGSFTLGALSPNEADRLLSELHAQLSPR